MAIEDGTVLAARPQQLKVGLRNVIYYFRATLAPSFLWPYEVLELGR